MALVLVKYNFIIKNPLQKYINESAFSSQRNRIHTRIHIFIKVLFPRATENQENEEINSTPNCVHTLGVDENHIQVHCSPIQATKEAMGSLRG